MIKHRFNQKSKKDTATLSPLEDHNFINKNKVMDKLPVSIQHIIIMVLNRAQDPEPEMPHISRQRAEESQTPVWGWLPILTLTSTLGMLSATYAFTSARSGATGVDFFFWLGLLL